MTLQPVSESTDIDQIGQLLRFLFVQAYRAQEQAITGVPSQFGARTMTYWDGGYDANEGKNRKAVWPKMARDCLENQIDPATFVLAQFTYRKDLPRANQCYGPNAIARAQRTSDNADENLAFAYQTQRETLTVEACCLLKVEQIDQRVAVSRILSNTNLPLSSLFRYIIAAKYDYPELASKYRDSALFQYIFRRDAYDRTWRDIPTGFRKEATDVISPKGLASA